MFIKAKKYNSKERNKLACIAWSVAVKIGGEGKAARLGTIS